MEPEIPRVRALRSNPRFESPSTNINEDWYLFMQNSLDNSDESKIIKSQVKINDFIDNELRTTKYEEDRERL